MNLPILWKGISYTLAEFQSFLSQQLAKETLLHWERSILNFAAQWCNPNISVFEVQSSGSTGKAKTIQLSRQAMIASAQATGKALSLQKGQSALLCLSADYIAGKMMIVRALELGLDFYYTQAQADILSHLTRTYDFCAVVPMQLQHAIDHQQTNNINLLRCILVGGDALPMQYVPPLQALSSRLYATYGMTETITHIALRPLNGQQVSDVYHCIAGVRVHTTPDGCLCIKAPHLSIANLCTTDMAILYSPTTFQLLGRKDFVINSGGIKINPLDLETKLAEFIILPFVTTAIPHPTLSKAVVLLIESEKPLANEPALLAQIKKALPAYHAPKQLLYTSQLPRKANGKIDRRACAVLAESLNGNIKKYFLE